jgi:hypothetical protein
MKTSGAADHLEILQQNFRGLYDRGVDDTAPEGYFIDALNNRFAEGEVGSRSGSALHTTKPNVRRFFVYKRLNETPRLIILDTNGVFFDSLAPGIPIYTDAAMVDFSMVNSNNRAYVTPHNRIRGITGKKLLVYEGSGNMRLAGGDPPTGFVIGAANSTVAGRVETGIHIFAMSYITTSGFITAPGPVAWTALNCPGGKEVDLSNLSVGPANTAARIVFATRSIPLNLYNGNQYAYELFFIPGAFLLDNVTTTLSVSFFDADLINSADYLIDVLPTIPAGLGVITYNNRLVSWGESGNEFTIRVSVPGQPEVFDSIGGFIQLDPADAISGVRNCFEFRQNLIIETSNRIYSTTDNGSDPSTWSVTSVDKSIGAECFTVATVLDARGTNTDRAFVATRAGLISYEGYAKRPELSFNIEGTWARINKALFNLVQIVDDPVNHRMFITVPLDSATAISHLLYADYSKAFTVYGTLDETAIKWSFWRFPSAPVSIMGDLDAVTNDPVLHIALAAGNIYTVKPGLTDDFGNNIPSYFVTNLKTVRQGWINHFGRLQFRIKGSGILAITLYGEDGVLPTPAPDITMLDNPGYEPESLINFQNEKMSVQCAIDSFGEYYTISKITTFAKPMWAKRPA